MTTMGISKTTRYTHLQNLFWSKPGPMKGMILGIHDSLETVQLVYKSTKV